MQHRIVIAGDTAGRFVRVGRDGFRVASGRDAINRASTTARPIVPHPTIIGIIIVTFFSQIPAFRMINYNNSMNVIGHHLIYPQFGVWKLPGYFIPNIIGNFTHFIEFHHAVYHIAKITFAVCRTNGNKIRSVVGIIPPRCTCGLYPVFPGKFFHGWFVIIIVLFFFG